MSEKINERTWHQAFTTRTKSEGGWRTTLHLVNHENDGTWRLFDITWHASDRGHGGDTHLLFIATFKSSDDAKEYALLPPRERGKSNLPLEKTKWKI